ncbi:MAG TPA: site-specific integrase [Acidothermaceae bacterium]
MRAEPDFVFWHLAIHTGMRRGELLGLKWADVDLAHGQVSVRRGVVAVGYQVQISEPKTARSRRLVALDDATVRLLEEHRSVRNAAGGSVAGSAFLFAGADGHPFHPDHVYGRFVRLRSLAGLPAIRFHDLRHTHATLALASGVNPKIISERLGHASVAFTMDVYSHAIPSLQADAARALADLIGPPASR